MSNCVKPNISAQFQSVVNIQVVLKQNQVKRNFVKLALPVFLQVSVTVGVHIKTLQQ